MKIAGRAGHNILSPGASALVDEVAEDRPIFLASKKYLEKNNNFIDCTPDPVANQSIDLYYGINKANNNNTDFFYSVHLNKAYDRYDGAIGSEIWLYPLANQDTINKANRILANLEALGFKNRGIKWCDNGEHRYVEIYDTNCEAMIIECFFLEATRDVEIYKSVGADALGFAIANGIDASIVKENSPISILEYENELCRIIVNGNNAIALTGKTKCINYSMENYEGSIKIQCIKNNAIVAEFVNTFPKPEISELQAKSETLSESYKQEVKETGLEETEDLTKGQMTSTNNEVSYLSKYNWVQLILKFFIDLINKLFKK